jgi:DNA-binding CsgD family transcriptional regulator
MASLSASSQYKADELFRSLLRQRARPYVIALDENLNIPFADPHALALLATHFPSDHPTSALPRALRDAVGDVIHRWAENGVDLDQSVVALGGLILRIAPLLGQCGCFYAVFVEKEARREDLREAVTRFSLTPREVEVLDLILDGLQASEIADRLHIAEVTVFDHFKHISYKTRARNRADMLAKVFNWQTGLKVKGPATRGCEDSNAVTA